MARLNELLERYRPSSSEANSQKDLRGFEWYYRWRQAHSDILTLKGHDSYVTSIAFSPDGKRLASASFDKTIKVWDATPKDDNPPKTSGQTSLRNQDASTKQLAVGSRQQAISGGQRDAGRQPAEARTKSMRAEENRAMRLQRLSMQPDS